VRVKTGGTQLRRQLSELLARHVNDYRCVLGDGVPFEGRAFPSAKAIAQKHYLRGKSAIREGYPCRCGCAECGRDARHDLELDSGAAQGFHLFAGSAIQQRVTSLEANHRQSLASDRHHQRINFFLSDTRMPAAFSHILNARRSRGKPENFRIDQVVMQDDPGLAQNPASFHCEQFRITGTRTDKVDFSLHKVFPRMFRRSA